MRNSIKHLLILLPLAILIALPCSAKREIKRQINVPVLQLNVEKGESLKTCLTSLQELDQATTQPTISLEKSLALTPVSTYSLKSAFTASPTIALKPISSSIPTVPLFLLHRQLIIYF